MMLDSVQWFSLLFLSSALLGKTRGGCQSFQDYEPVWTRRMAS